MRQAAGLAAAAAATHLRNSRRVLWQVEQAGHAREGVVGQRPLHGGGRGGRRRGGRCRNRRSVPGLKRRRKRLWLRYCGHHRIALLAPGVGLRDSSQCSRVRTDTSTSRFRLQWRWDGRWESSVEARPVRDTGDGRQRRGEVQDAAQRLARCPSQEVELLGQLPQEAADDIDAHSGG